MGLNGSEREPLTYRELHWSKEQLARLRKIEPESHERAFGEELARVNLDMTIEERHQYLAWIVAREHGVPPSPRPFRYNESADPLEQEKAASD